MASVLLPPVASLQSSPEPARFGVAPTSQEPPVQPYAERLRLRLREAPQAPTPRRNPFLFEQRTLTTSPVSAPRAVVEQAPREMLAGPEFELAGVATSQTGAELVRTAVVSVRGDVLLVRPGDRLPGGYTVARVEEDALIVADASGRELVLHLK